MADSAEEQFAQSCSDNDRTGEASVRLIDVTWPRRPTRSSKLAEILSALSEMAIDDTSETFSMSGRSATATPAAAMSIAFVIVPSVTARHRICVVFCFFVLFL